MIIHHCVDRKVTPDDNKMMVKRIPKGNYKNLSKKKLIKAANNVYYDMPELRKIAVNTIKRYYK